MSEGSTDGASRRVTIQQVQKATRLGNWNPDARARHTAQNGGGRLVRVCGCGGGGTAGLAVMPPTGPPHRKGEEAWNGRRRPPHLQRLQWHLLTVNNN